MIDQRFSKKEFEHAGKDSPSARQLADRLAEEITSELHGAIQAELQRIVMKLNGMGHNLRLYVENPGELAYRDDSGDGDNYQCDLRVAADCVVSTGYAHLLSDQE